MRVLILEPDLTGHHAPYLRHLLEALRALGQEAIVVTSPGATITPHFALHLRQVAADVVFDESASAPTNRTLADASGKFHALRSALERYQPDHVWVPYADYLTEYAALRTIVLGKRLWPARVETEGLYFRGRFAYREDRWQRNLKPVISRQLIPRSPWTVLHWLDPLAWEAIQQGNPSQAERFRVMPDPVEPVVQVDRAVARQQLGIPVDGTYAGCVGVLNVRKGVDLLVAAFHQARLDKSVRLLLAGPLDKSTRIKMEPLYGDLLRAGQIIHIARHLTVDEVMTAILACDLVCVTNRYQFGSSSMVIRAAAAHRPVLADDFSWMGWAVPRFQLGWTTCVHDISGLADRLREAMEKVGGWKPAPTADRLVRFHSAENFQAHWTANLRQRLGAPDDKRHVPWEWVLDESVSLGG